MSLETPLNRETRSSKKKHKMEVPVPSSIEIVDVEAFCFTPISHKGTNKSTAISVEQYAHDRDLRLAIATSLGLSTPAPVIDLSDNDDDDHDDDVLILNSKPQNTPFGKRRRNSNDNNNNININSISNNNNNNNNSCAEKGESSNSNSTPFHCDLCADTKTASESFSISGCSHAYCTECVVRYVRSKLQENVINIRCPERRCRGLLEPEDCREILPKEVFDRWGHALCEAVIVASEKFYCPFMDCSALLIDDGEDVIRETECPNCRRLFCAQCKAPWHQGIECEEFQKLNKDEREREDIMLLQLAKEMRWRRCPNCRFYVAKSEGCMYMKCRCGNAFCYNCGAAPRGHTHFCFNCRR